MFLNTVQTAKNLIIFDSLGSGFMLFNGSSVWTYSVFEMQLEGI